RTSVSSASSTGRSSWRRRSTVATIRPASTASEMSAGLMRSPGRSVVEPERPIVDADTPAGGQAPILELRGLSKNFGGLHAVRRVTFKIMPGDRAAIIGPNGAGKTTLFNLITGILPASSGRVLLFGRDVTRWPSHRRTAMGMARTFQISHLFPKLSVIDNVLLALTGLTRTKWVMWRPLSSYGEVYARAHEVLGQTGFRDREHVEVRNLSHGEQRQLEIALGLASKP